MPMKIIALNVDDNVQQQKGFEPHSMVASKVTVCFVFDCPGVEIDLEACTYKQTDFIVDVGYAYESLENL